MIKKMIQKNKLVFVFSVLTAFMGILAGLGGCGNGQSFGINPYEFLSRADSVDHTQFFIDAYQAFQVAGVPLTPSTTTTTTSTTTTTPTMTQVNTVTGQTGKTIR
jgi:hypothetical protein